MKITINQLRQIIKEELDKVIEPDPSLEKIVKLVKSGKRGSKEYEKEAKMLNFRRFAQIGMDAYKEKDVVVDELVSLGLRDTIAEEVVDDILYVNSSSFVYHR
jgi:hypothetical protein